MGELDDVLIFCPRCGSLTVWKLDGQGKRGECLNCGRVSCGHELARLMESPDGVGYGD